MTVVSSRPAAGRHAAPWQPTNTVEESLAAAIAAGDLAGYLAALATARLMVLVHAMSAQAPQWRTATEQDRTFVVAFTSRDAMRLAVGGVERHLLLDVGDLAGAWPDPEWGLAVDPGLPIGSRLPSHLLLELATAAPTAIGSGPVPEPRPSPEDLPEAARQPLPVAEPPEPLPATDADEPALADDGPEPAVLAEPVPAAGVRFPVAADDGTPAADAVRDKRPPSFATDYTRPPALATSHNPPPGDVVDHDLAPAGMVDDYLPPGGIADRNPPAAATHRNPPHAGTADHNPPLGRTADRNPPHAATHRNPPPARTADHNLPPGRTADRNPPPGTTYRNPPPAGTADHSPSSVSTHPNQPHPGTVARDPRSATRHNSPSTGTVARNPQPAATARRVPPQEGAAWRVPPQEGAAWERGPTASARATPTRVPPAGAPPVRPGRLHVPVLQVLLTTAQVARYRDECNDRVSGVAYHARDVAGLGAAALVDLPGGPDPAKIRDADEQSVHVIRWLAFGRRTNGSRPAPPTAVTGVRLPHGAQVVRIMPDGAERRVGVFDAIARSWRRGDPPSIDPHRGPLTDGWVARDGDASSAAVPGPDGIYVYAGEVARPAGPPRLLPLAGQVRLAYRQAVCQWRDQHYAITGMHPGWVRLECVSTEDGERSRHHVVWVPLGEVDDPHYAETDTFPVS